jgi:ERCC4-type nuclease
MADCIGHKGMEIITIDSSDDDSILRVVTPREFKANRRSNDISSSSESSHDSIWDKGISAPRLSQRSENQVSRSPRLGKYIASNGNEVNDLCDDSDESSSLSSNDSIWNRVGTLSIGHNNESQVKLDEVDTDLPLRKDVANSKTRDDETNLTAIFDNDLVSVDSSHEKQHEQSISDGSSISSSDSILKNTFFARKKEQPIHSYYDYCKYYRKSSTGAQEKTISQVTSSHTSISAIDTNFTINKVLSPSDAQWKIVLLMDHREFGCSNNFLQQVETQINNHFGGKHAEITTLPSADYLYVARLISTSANNFGEILDERVLDVAIERKAVQDVCQCLIADSKKYHPLSFFEAQMYKLMNCGMSKKLFLMEGDEDTSKRLMYGAKSIEERKKRLKRVKTLRCALHSLYCLTVDAYS